MSSEQVAEALRKALKENERLRAERRSLTATLTEPVAVVGMACRYPGGARTPDELWALVTEGRDAISPFPDNRGWDVSTLYDPDPGRVGTSYTCEGGFLHDADAFDPAFFAMSPREALTTDPQQRLLLETSWESFERAGIDPDMLRGSKTGVFVGVMYSDYGSRLQPMPEDFEGYIGIGSAPSVASGRIAYTFGLEGPAITVDTACSSSLVALHLACQALRNDECALALAGGATVLATPTTFIEFSRQRGLSADGRCKSYASAADGTGWGEGVGMLLLERLSAARRNGHPVLAVIRGSAVNQDGRSSQLSAPNGPSQRRVITQALANAGLTTHDVDAVEGHGTGTPLGDPIEAQALIGTYGRGRDAARPLRLGSIKSNIGHTQAAAGAAGVIKMVQAIRNGVLPKTLHVDQPSGHVDWSDGTVRVLTESVPWPETGRPRRAAVSSFGVSGTNAHVIIEEAPAAAPVPAPAPDEPAAPSCALVAWTVSAKSAQALTQQAGQMAEFAARNPGADPAGVARALATGRALFTHRAVALGEGDGEIEEALRALAAGQPHPRVVSGVAQGLGKRGLGKTVFVFPGQGSQWAGMGRELLECAPAFREQMEQCAEALAPLVDWSLLGVLRGEPGAPAFDRDDVVQPVLFAVMVSLARMWQAAGVRPQAVVGHSQGEIAAAYIAGALSLQDAVRIVTVRSRAVGALAGGGMASLALPAEEVGPGLAAWEGRLEVATVNGPDSTVIAGDFAAIDEAVTAYEAKGVRARRIPVNYASHSPQVDAIRDEVVAGLTGIRPRRGEIAFYSTVTAQPMDTAALDAEYWFANLRRTVRFEQATRALLDAGHRAFVEISPHPVLSIAMQETLDAAGAGDQAAVLGSLRREEPQWQQFLTNAARLHVRGGSVDWNALTPALTPEDRGTGRAALSPLQLATVQLPTYPFLRESHWIATPDAAARPADLGLAEAGHRLLGAAVSLAEGGGWVFTGRLSLRTHPWLDAHRVGGSVLVPGAALVELALHAGHQVGRARLEELTLQAPLILDERGAVHIQVTVTQSGEFARSAEPGRCAEPGESEKPGSGSCAVTVFSRAADREQDPWTLHAQGFLGDADREAGRSCPAQWPPAGAVAVEPEELYAALADAGYGYGPLFQGVRAAWQDGTDVYAEVALPGDTDVSGFGIHPALLDAALHPAAATATATARGDAGAGAGAGADAVKLPFSWTDVVLHASGATTLRVVLRTNGSDSLGLTGYDPAGAAVVRVGGLVLRAVSADALSTATAGGADQLFHLRWEPVPTPTAQPAAAETAAVTHAISDDFDSLVAALDAGGEAPSIVFWETTPGTGADEPTAAVHDVTRRTLELAQRWTAEARLADTRLVVLTRGAVATRTGEHVRDLAQAAVWGLIRTAQNENPGRFALLDLDGAAPDAGVLLAAAAADEPQLALRLGTLHAPRLARAATDSGLILPDDGSPWRLDAPIGGSLDDIALIPWPEAAAPLPAGHVRVSVRAAGLNFRDVMVTLGLVQDVRAVGGEAAGEVLEVAPDVSGFKPGDRVMGMFRGTGPVAVTDHRLLAHVPEGWSFAQAAAIPVVFLTAYYGLVDLGRLKKGDKLLLHAATGGVGMAALQLARVLGATVYATASPGKWETLRELGVPDERIASSRDLRFEESFRAAAGTVDVVLNSLAAQYVDASLRLLGPGGRFVEMGKTDIREAAALGAAHPGVEYFAYDVMQAGADRIERMWAHLTQLFASGELRPLPVSTYDVRHVVHALRHLSQARHTGKLVLTMPPRLDPDGTVLMTGATGTLGALTARRLVTGHGVRHLLLTSRRGAAAPGAADLARELRGLGASVRIECCDAADRGALAALLATIPAAHPLTAVVHTAGVLDDATISALTPDRLDRVLRPKVDAAWNLHELTRDLPVARFVLFSSASGTLGTPGQGNYAAANAYLDALAQSRLACGLSATSLAWGLWEQASGMTAHLDQSDHNRLKRGGLTPLTTEDGLSLFDTALGSAQAVLIPTNLDVRALSAMAAEPPHMLRGLVRAPLRRAAAGAAADAESFTRRLGALSAADQERAVLDLIVAHAATVLGHGSADRVQVELPFKELGFDSLTAVELRNRVNDATGLRLASTVVFDHPTPVLLARHVLGELDPQAAAGASAALLADLGRLESRLAEVDQGSDVYVEAMTRMQVLVRRWSRAGEAGAVAGALDDASDDELFAALDELGASA
ncbi:SDR family NAD(P)-dependent oxidoreductase [Actinocrinis puniceicyclus]|uniref:SDR family NAD(P)-dependent oxidoreductase n=1 Tax=Actinocrinis puniceicyclus TaxID=977794 RepID=UPI003F68AE46